MRPDHKTTAEFRVPGRARAGRGTEADSTIVDEPADDPLTRRSRTSRADDPEDDPVDGPEVTFHDLPADDPEATSFDPPVDDPGVTSRDAAETPSATVTDIRIEKPVPPQEEQAAFEQGPMPASVTAERPAPAPVGERRPGRSSSAASRSLRVLPRPLRDAVRGLGTGPQPDATAPAMPSGDGPGVRSSSPGRSARWCSSPPRRSWSCCSPGAAPTTRGRPPSLRHRPRRRRWRPGRDGRAGAR